MIKKVVVMGIFSALMLTVLMAETLPFNEEHFYPKSIIVAFTKQAIGNQQGTIDITKENDIVKTNIDDLNYIANEFQIVDLIQLHSFVAHPEWNDNGIYLQNIYKVVLKNNENIEKAQEALDKAKSVLFAEYETINKFKYIPNDPEFSQQWHHSVIQTPETWDYTKGSKEVIVSITDSGVKWNHPDLQNNIWINEAELPGITIDWANGKIIGGDGIDNDGNGKIDDVIGWDFVDEDNNPYQYGVGSPHGTHVAGCTGAVGDNGIGVAGASMNVSIMVCKGSPTNQEASGVQYGYPQIQYSAMSGADFINCSWGGPGNGSYATSIVNYATGLGSLVIVAAGNDNAEHNSSYKDYPADVPNAFCVAASGNGDLKTNFSDYGEPIDILAPGINIRSTWINPPYSSQQGTSMASPIVAGVAALVKSVHPHLTPLQMKERIMLTSDYVEDKNNEMYHGLLGAGRINAFKATMYDLVPNLSVFDYNIEEFYGDGDGIPNPGEEIDLYVHLYNEIDWMTATNIKATISTELEGVEILADLVEYDRVDGGSVNFNTSFPFRFKTREDLSDLTIPFDVTLSAHETGEFPYKKTFKIKVELSLQEAGWPLATSGVSTSSAVITDINGDGTNEIVFGDSQGNLHVIKIDQTPLPGFPIYLGGAINTAVAAADLTRNGKKEIVVNSSTGMIYCVDYKGKILFDYNAGGQLRSNPMIIDVDGDNRFEIVALTFNNPKLIILNADGSEYPGFPVSIGGSVISSAASADLDNDGYKEIIFTLSTGKIHAISTKNGEDVAGWPQEIGAASWNGPIVGDLTGDNKPSVVVATIQGNVYAFKNDGSTLFSKNVGNAIRSGVLAYDLDGDRESEIVFVDMAGTLHVLKPDGSYKENFPVDTKNPTESTPILADMDLDGKLDIIYGDTGGYLHSIGLDGKETLNFPISLHSSISISPAIGYVKPGDTPGILIPNQNGYNLIDYKRPIGEIAWGMFRGNERRSGNFADLTAVDKNLVPTPNLTTLHGNYPNPFNPETEISFSLSAPSQVEITVYNAKGQVVKTLINEPLNTGTHSVVWNGKNDIDKNVSSGLYFYTFRAGSYSKTQKMMLLK